MWHLAAGRCGGAALHDLVFSHVYLLHQNASRYNKRYKAADGRGKTTIRVQREHDARARAIAEVFEGKKSYAIQALLWRGLEHTDEEPHAELPDRPVLITGELYARVARLTLALREERGKVVPIKEFVEEALRRAVEREERRIQQAPKKNEP